MSDKTIGNAFVNKLIDKLLVPNSFTVQKAGSQIVWIPITVFDPSKGKKIMIYENGKPKLRPITRAEDFFGCVDILAVHPTLAPYTFFIQATVGGSEARRQRMRKLEAVPWNLKAHRVMLIQRDDEDKQLIWLFTLNEEGDSLAWTKWPFNFRHDTVEDFLKDQAVDAELPIGG